MARSANRCRSFCLVTLLAATTAPFLSAQCTLAQVPGDPYPGVDGMVLAATTWDPDGIGPLPLRIVVGGYFAIAGASYADHVASYDPATGQWERMGTEYLWQMVMALTTMPNGDVVAGLKFAATDSVRRWNGATWGYLSGLPLGGAHVVAALANGDVLASGPLTGGQGPCGVQRWNGSGWQAVGSASYAFGEVRALLQTTNGDLLVGSNTAVHRWDGVAWATLGGASSPTARSLAQMPNGDIVAGSDSDVMRWDGASWQPFGPPLGNPVLTLQPLPNGDLIAGGTFTLPGPPISRGIAVGNGASWTNLAGGAALLWKVIPWSNGDLFAVGNFDEVGGAAARGLARWNGVAWSPPGSSCFDGAIYSLRVLRSGDAVAVGDFTRAPGVAAQNVARWNGTTWSPLGSGLAGDDAGLVVELDNGDLLATVWTGYLQNVMRWDGASWSTFLALPSGSSLSEMLVMPNGDLVVAGTFSSIGGQPANRIARWDGAAWHPLGSGLTTTSFKTWLAVLPNGDLVAAGALTNAGGVPVNGIAKWNGTSWSAIGTPPPGFYGCTTVMANGDLVALNSNRVVRWDGTQWSIVVPNVNASALLGLPNGDLLLCSFGDVLRFDSSTSSLVTINHYDWGNGAQLVSLADDSIAVIGNFLGLGGLVSPRFGRLSSTCPATNAKFGVGCATGGGNSVLAATSLPWIGASWTVRTTGVAANTFAVRVLGLGTQQVALSPALPQALPGCHLLVTGDFLDFATATSGTLTASLAIPRAASLVGLSLHQQMIPFVLDALGNLVQVTATNGVSGTVGAL